MADSGTKSNEAASTAPGAATPAVAAAASEKKRSDMPVWVSDTELNAEWVAAQCGVACDSCPVKDVSNENRDGATLRLSVHSGGDSTTPSLSLIMKQTAADKAGQVATAKALGLAREAYFYSLLAPALGATVPRIYYSHGEMETGLKCVIMEDLASAIDSGVFFGPGNPNNRKRDLKSMVARAGPNPPSAEDVALETFKAIALTHAQWWKDTKLFDAKYHFLRGCEWVQGKGKEKFDAAQAMCRTRWTDAKAMVDEEKKTGPGGIKWDPLVLETLEAAVNGISWEKQQERLHTKGNWTLVHGDFWPGNVMWCPGQDQKVKLVDWEMVGLGSGPQDLGQYILSNMESAVRKKCEKSLVEAYYKTLIEHGVSRNDLSWEACWREYQLGGLERWLWFLCYFAGGGEHMVTWTQYFHDQVSDFMHDHQLGPKDVVQPRP